MPVSPIALPLSKSLWELLTISVIELKILNLVLGGRTYDRHRDDDLVFDWHSSAGAEPQRKNDLPPDMYPEAWFSTTVYRPTLSSATKRHKA